MEMKSIVNDKTHDTYSSSITPRNGMDHVGPRKHGSGGAEGKQATNNKQLENDPTLFQKLVERRSGDRRKRSSIQYNSEIGYDRSNICKSDREEESGGMVRWKKTRSDESE
ncbi:hypothetical protein QCA50_011243 [Cerrena zonata]|uniref:Uncharacterized protein n=1 Tax=Cerrena zonata TaxID=2478898 RepID=A0AAW0FW02_9APHY